MKCWENFFKKSIDKFFKKCYICINLKNIFLEVQKMKIYTASCIDSKTRMEIILSDCSYNNACYYLEGNYFNSIDGKIKTRWDRRTDRILIFAVDEKENIISRVFCYDEIRGLLGIEKSPNFFCTKKIHF